MSRQIVFLNNCFNELSDRHGSYFQNLWQADLRNPWNLIQLQIIFVKILNTKESYQEKFQVALVM